MSARKAKNEASLSPMGGRNSDFPKDPEELNILPEYIGPDAIHIYSDDELPIYWTDPVGDHWWLVQRPDGSYAKLPMDV